MIQQSLIGRLTLFYALFKIAYVLYLAHFFYQKLLCKTNLWLHVVSYTTEGTLRENCVMLQFATTIIFNRLYENLNAIYLKVSIASRTQQPLFMITSHARQKHNCLPLLKRMSTKLDQTLKQSHLRHIWNVLDYGLHIWFVVLSQTKKLENVNITP